MAIEKNPLLSLVGGTSMPQQPEFDESELEIEIEDPDDEGMAGINAIAEEDELALQAAQDDHYANLAELIDPQDLAQITGDIIDSYQADKESREEWESTFERGFDLLGLKLQETSEPFEGSCTAVSPLIIEAAVKFQSKASIELFPSGGPVRTQIVGDADKEREDQATRVQDFMNYQFTEQISEYFDEFEKMLFHLPLIGSAFKKMYYDPALRRPCSEFIPIDQFYVSYYASDIQKAERYTQVIHRSITEMERDVKSGMYMDVGLEDPTTPDPTSFTSKIDSIMGISPADDFDQQYVLLEQHCYLDLPEPFSSEDGVALPYVVTVEKQSRQIIAIRRNWAKEDETLSKQTYFTHYKFVPGFGFYGLGLIHLLGNMTMSATAALRSLVDAGQFSNLPGGFKARGVRIVGSNDPIAPGEFREVEATGLDLQKSIVPLPYKEPSQTLYNMLTFLTGAGQKFADSTEQIVNESSNYGPVGTTMALIESSAKFFSAIHKRLHKSQRDEFRILSKINFEFLPDEYPYDVPNITTSVFKSDFDGRVDVIPVSDPNIPSAAHRLSMAQMVLQLSSQAPQGMYNIEQVHLSILKAANIQNPDRFFTPKTPPEPHDPITDIDLVVKGMPIQAFPQQDHAAHIAIKTAFIDDPTLGKTEMMAPAVPVLQANIQQHMVMQYQEQISGLMKAETPPGEVSPEVLSQLSINAAEQVLEANMGTAPEDSLENQNLLLESARLDLDQQKLQMTATKDAAELSIKNRELDLKEMGVQLDAAEKVSESEQKKIDARIRDQSSIRTTNAKLTIESLKNLAKERDLMIDKRMNEDRYASGGPVRLAQGGEFFEEFLRGRGGREAFTPETDFLEGLLAKIGGGRRRTADELISDTWEGYKFELRDSDSIDDNEKYQKIIEMEQKQDTETPIIDSDINTEFPDQLGDWKPQSPGSSDPDAETFVPEGSLDLETDPKLDIDLTPERVDIGIGELEGPTPEGFDIGIGPYQTTIQNPDRFPTPKIPPEPVKAAPSKMTPKITLPVEAAPPVKAAPPVEVPVDKSYSSMGIEESLYGEPNVKQQVYPKVPTEAYAPPKPPVIIDNKKMRDEIARQKRIKEQRLASSYPDGMLGGEPEPGSVDDKGILDTVSEWWSDVSIMPDSLDNVTKPRPLSEVFNRPSEVSSLKPEPVISTIGSSVRKPEPGVEYKAPKSKMSNLNSWLSYIHGEEGFNPSAKGYKDTKGQAYGAGLNWDFLSANQKDRIRKNTKNFTKDLDKRISDEIVEEKTVALAKRFKQDKKLNWSKMNPARQAALLGMAFNMGFDKTTGKGKKSFKKTYELIQKGKFKEASEEVLRNSAGTGPSDFKKQLGKRADRLVIMLRDGVFIKDYGL